MKKAVFIVIVILSSKTAFTQNSRLKAKSLPNPNNRSVTNFLHPIETNQGFLSFQVKTGWDTKRFNDEYNRLLEINKQKELYPILLLDNRFVSQAIPARYSSQSFMWVSTELTYKNFGEELANDLISGFFRSGRSKKHGLNFNNPRKGYYTPLGRKY